MLTFTIICSIGSLAYLIPWAHEKFLLCSIVLNEEDFHNADSKKFSEIAKKATPFRQKQLVKYMEDLTKKTELLNLINSQDEPTFE